MCNKMLVEWVFVIIIIIQYIYINIITANYSNLWNEWYTNNNVPMCVCAPERIL